MSFYTAASLAREARFEALYDPAQLQARQEEIIGGGAGVILFNRPVLYAIILSPLSLLPYDRAFLVWLVLNSVALVGCWVWAIRSFGCQAAVFGVLYPPALLGVAHGQDCAILLCLATGAFVLAGRNRPLWSGALLGMGLFKFHLFLLWPLAIVVRRDWKMLTGFGLSGGAVWLAPSLAMGWSSYLRLLASHEADVLALSAHKQISVWGLTANFGIVPIWWSTALAAVVVLFVLPGIRKAGPPGLFRGAISGSLAVAPHLYGYDATMLLLPLWQSMFQDGRGLVKQGARLLALPPVWAFLAFEPPFAGIVSASVLALTLLAAIAPARPLVENGQEPTG
ncbi:MAG TPA: glycosyltransferase family 87 protein [Bryobacteraceae bacterium]|nr:glycosyltransferase family 87 protein [Bryobacteraceae bacterium]